jgi:hypothetical protein
MAGIFYFLLSAALMQDGCGKRRVNPVHFRIIRAEAACPGECQGREVELVDI